MAISGDRNILVWERSIRDECLSEYELIPIMDLHKSDQVLRGNSKIRQPICLCSFTSIHLPEKHVNIMLLI